MKAIEFQKLTKHFESVEAVKSIDLEIEEGQIFGLLGPNGAGKTTLVEMLVGLIEPTEGTAKVFGKDIKDDYREVHEIIGLAPTEHNFDREFNVFENLKHHAGYFGYGRKERKRKVEKYLKRFDLWDKRKEKTYFLSSGMRKKLLIARAMITDPDILILDEPTAALDVETRWMIHDTIEDLANQGLTIILTTHYIEEAEKLCERVAIMNEGKIIADASPRKLISEGKDDLLKIKLKNEIKSIPNELKNQEMEIKNLNSSEMYIKTENANEATPKILKALLDYGYQVKSIDIKESDLEDIFCAIT